MILTVIIMITITIIIILITTVGRRDLGSFRRQQHCIRLQRRLFMDVHGCMAGRCFSPALPEDSLIREHTQAEQTTKITNTNSVTGSKHSNYITITRNSQTNNEEACMRAHLCIYLYIYIYTSIYSCVYIYTYIHIYIDTFITCKG